MDKLNEILRQSKEQAKTVSHELKDAAAKGAQQTNTLLTRKEVTKFFAENKLPRYLLYGIILVKAATIYDKMKQIVAINSVYE